MKKLTKRNRRLFSNEKGQGMVEYILLLVIVIALIGIFKDRIKTAIADKTGQVGDGINSFQGE